MPNFLGPSHYIYFASIHRRRLWHRHLAQSFDSIARPTWPAQIEALRASYVCTMSRLTDETHFGLSHPLPLLQVLDDTPIESFLNTLAEEIANFEIKLIQLFSQHSLNSDWISELEQTSMLWGRELAHEWLITMSKSNAHPRSLQYGPTIRGLFQIFVNVLEGGDFNWTPLLLRRSTDKELTYEMRQCPHTRGSGPATDTACRLESNVYKGFAQALIENVEFERKWRGSYCLDELHLR